jgi:4-amino-4-deoxy-L-arabinose transferase-like glycosyltransferase
LCFALGLATLAKGLVGAVLPLMIIAPYLILTGALRSLMRPRLLVFGALIFLATAAVWYAPVVMRNGREFIDEFFIGHHFQRYLSNKYRHPQPFYFFPLIALAGSFPWSFYLLASLPRPDSWASLKRWRQASSERTPDDRLHLFLLLWIVVPVVFFSLSGSKLPGYILPIFPAVALIVGRELDRWWSDKSRPSLAPQFLTASLLAAAGIIAGFLLPRELGLIARDAWLMGSLAVLVAAVYLGLLLFKSGRIATLYLPIGLAMIIAAAAHLVFPALGNRESLKKLSLTAIQSARHSERLVFFINHDHGVNFYATQLPLRDDRSELVTAKSAEEIARLIEAGGSQSILVMSPRQWSDGVTKSGTLRAEKIGEHNFNLSCSPECDWVLLRAQPARRRER